MRVLKNAGFLGVLVLVFCAGNIATVRADEVDNLINRLKDKDWLVRVVTAIELGKIKDNRAVEPLIAALKDKDWLVRATAVESLGKIGDRRAIEPLVVTLKDKDWLVQVVVAEVLGEIGDSKAVELLIAILKDKDWRVRKKVRKQAVLILAKITGVYFGKDPEKWQKWWEQNKEKFRNAR